MSFLKPVAYMQVRNTDNWRCNGCGHVVQGAANVTLCCAMCGRKVSRIESFEYLPRFEALLRKLLPMAMRMSCMYNRHKAAALEVHCCDWNGVVQDICETLGVRVPENNAQQCVRVYRVGDEPWRATKTDNPLAAKGEDRAFVHDGMLFQPMASEERIDGVTWTMTPMGCWQCECGYAMYCSSLPSKDASVRYCAGCGMGIAQVVQPGADGKPPQIWRLWDE